MDHPRQHALTSPDKAAYVMAGSGERVTYGELEARANQGARLFRAAGLGEGAAIALFMDNGPRYFEIVWAAQRSGLRFTCISSKLTAGEAAYIIEDSGSKALIASASLAGVAGEVARAVPGLTLWMTETATPPFARFEAARDEMATAPIADESLGSAMLYSSGTTGRPKGVRRAELAPRQPIDTPNPLMLIGQGLLGFSPEMVYLSPAPLYHAAPLYWSMAVHALGGTVVAMERFDAEGALEAIERHGVTSAQWVPTHFVRMLKLPAETRARYDLSSLKSVFHAAAPCPVQVKEAMIDWWGPIVHEYYAGTEGNGFCFIDSQTWLTRKGSVGRGLTAAVKICDEAGNELPARAEGGVYFAGGGAFEYHNDPEKTAESRNRHGWTTLGDVGWLDEDGYLYLTDRKSFMIISGGVNIYPQEIENLLIGHPKIADVAVVGAPHEEMGEEVVAVVQPADWEDANDALAADIMAFARASLSHVKAPRRVDFMRELPRHATGKLYKRLIRDAYWGKGASTIV